MPFVFNCVRCGSVLYEDQKPVLQDGTFRHETYLETVVMKIGGNCPRCGRKLNVIPLRVEVSALKLL